jgi:hypothetical protein
MDFLLQLIAKKVLNIDPSTITKEIASDAVRRRMEDAIPNIAAKMEARGLTPPSAMPVPVIRDALFRLWRVVIPSGTLADAIRDAQDDKVVAKVQPKITAASTVAEVVTWTKDEALEIAF